MKNHFFLFLILLNCSIVFSQIPSTGLVLHYPFLGNANDYSGNNFNGSVSGSSLTTDRFNDQNRAYQFDGIDDFLIVPNNPALKVDFPFTVSLWVNISSLSNASTSIVFTNDEGVNYYSGFYIGCNPSGNITAGYGNGNGVSSGSRRTKHSSISLNTSSWHHVLAVYYDYFNIDLYIDCVYDSSAYYSGTGLNLYNSNFNTGSIGRSLGHSPGSLSCFNGKIDDIRLYDVALDINGIRELCTEDAYLTIEEEVTSSNPRIDQSRISIYPNPVESQLMVESDNRDSRLIVVTDVLGRTLFREKYDDLILQIDFSNWSQKEIYFVKIFDENGNLVKSKKVFLK